MNGLAFGPFELALAAGLVLVNATLSLIADLGIHRSILIASARMVAQLLLVGFVLGYIFTSADHWLSLLVIAAMLCAATFEVGSRQRSRLAGPWHYGLSGIAVSSGTVLVAGFALLTVADSADWTAPRIVIPIVGIILGSAMSASSVALNTMFGGVSAERAAIEAQLSLGRSRAQAMKPLMQRAIYAGTLPVLNQMAGAGVITLPGIMSGQILAGANPLTAAQSQIFLMLLLCAASTASVVAAVWLAARSLSDERDRLRLDRLQGR
ncbi:ABC transporter permease [Neorhizobium alkalisoli]|jgi:putative ABC transport system permease protein|uniref:Putative ABC transport system permease protein n=1 Tax=Neorhizobium alkalisoli TaxID=528178 RepID=A0A561QSD6_9HYPH|nr:ABC transporter permease [Neorhizobium alkalisoli]TWF53216.1 putative ABC transport system permease protein [Neorhizobium alkalisoli]